MKCITLIENIKQHWPNEIRIDESNPDQLNNLYWVIDSKIDDVKDPWLSVSAWAFHQALDIFIENEIDKGKSVIYISDILIQLFNTQMLFNLDEVCWEKEREEYQQP